MTELARLLERMMLEPAYGPTFYRALLDEPVYALLPTGDVLTPRATVRFVTWMGSDGRMVVPCFSGEELARRALTPDTQALGIQGRVLLDACRGIGIVLNPNERHSLRLTPIEIERLLETGSPERAEAFVADGSVGVAFVSPPAEPAFLYSLVLLFSQYPQVEAAFLATLCDIQTREVASWLLVAIVDEGANADVFAHQLSAMLADQPPPSGIDLLTLTSRNPETAAYRENMTPFYDRVMGSHLIMESGSVLKH